MSNVPTEPKENHSLPGKPLVNRLRSNLGATFAAIFYGGLAAILVFMFCAHTFWYGELIAVHCQTVSPGQADCVLTYRALLRRSWDWPIAGVEAIRIDTRITSSSEGNPETYYVATLKAQGKNYVIKRYSRPDHRELEMWRHHVSQFSENPEEDFAITVNYNPWQPIISLFLLFGIGIIFLFVLMPLFLVCVVLILLAIKYFIDVLKATNYRDLVSSACRRIHFLPSNFSFQTIHSRTVGAVAMAISSRRHSRFSPTLVLLVGLALGSFGLVVWLGLRWIVVSSSLAICAAAIALWQRQLNHHKRLVATAIESANLLQKDTFLAHLGHLETQFPGISQPLWRSACQRAEAIRQFADQIAQQETTFIPDLLEALHTVLDLVEQLAQALKAVQRVKTYHYQQLAQEQLYRSQKRLEHTHNQLQALRDQMIVGSLQQPSPPPVLEISTWLQTLIADNEKGLLGE